MHQLTTLSQSTPRGARAYAEELRRAEIDRRLAEFTGLRAENFAHMRRADASENEKVAYAALLEAMDAVTGATVYLVDPSPWERLCAAARQAVRLG